MINKLKEILKNENNSKTSKDRSLQRIDDLIPIPKVESFCSNLLEAYKENKKSKVELEKIKVKREIVLKEMEMKYDLYNKVFHELFYERRIAIDKSFEIIDRGVANNDKELISMGLSSLSKIVSSSPFTDLISLSNSLENNQIIEL